MFKTQVIFVFSAVYLATSMSLEAPQCQGVDMQMSEAATMNIMDCLTEVSAATIKDVPEDKRTCFGKCILMKKSVVDEGGMAHPENIKMLLEGASLPQPVADDLTKKMEQCITDNGSNLQTAGETCDSFSPLIECMHMAFQEVCKA